MKQTKAQKAASRRQVKKLMKRNWLLYLFIIPAVVYMIIFCYAPMFGLQIAFKKYSIAKGFLDSPWVGWKWFETFVTSQRFWIMIKNTLTLSIYSIIVGFPLPVILALILNNIKNRKWKKFAQTITYMPHFISVVTLAGMLSIFLSPNSGMINVLLSYVGGSGDVYFLGKPEYFKHIYVWSGIWQSMGWGSIIYMAALSSVDPALHEAAMIDGANKFQRIRHVDLPGIMPTMAIMLIMNCGSILGVGYEKVYLLQNSLNSTHSEVISTYMYKMGLLQQQYSYSAAIGLFNNVINLIVLFIVNKIVGKLTSSSLW